MTYQAGIIKADDASTINLYGDRTAQTSCLYLLPHIKKTSNILDVGCGPGIITSDLAKIASEGETIGVDNNEGVIAQASAAYPAPNLSFAVSDALNLDFPDNSFDIVHAHALLVHVPSAVSAMKEFHRVCKPGGVVACREANMSAVLSLKPDLPSIRQYWQRAEGAMRAIGGNSNAGDKLEEWAREAGFTKIETSKGSTVQSKSRGKNEGRRGRKGDPIRNVHERGNGGVAERVGGV
jgi:ubiquinone/menaquinone biosynthesis C-methylase UbiE